MKRVLLVVAVCLLLAGLGWILWAVLQNPKATIRIVDEGGNPIEGAIIEPDGVRGADGGHYGWRDEFRVKARSVGTDHNGLARVEYPKFVKEKIRSLQISFSLTHSNFCPDRPFVTVDAPLTSKSSFRDRLDYLWTVLRLRSEPSVVAMKQGTVVRIAATMDEKPLSPDQFFVQGVVEDEDVPHGIFGSEGNERVSRQVPPGNAMIRIVYQDPEGQLFFSKPKRFQGEKGGTNIFKLAVEPGSPFHGKLDPSVPRPIQGGWVNTRVFYKPTGGWKGEELVWGDFAPVAPDGSFRFESLPEGRVELTAICDGFFAPGPIGKGPNGFVVPHSFELDDGEVVIPMQRTATAEIRVVNDSGTPLPEVTVWSSPNIQWGGYWSTLFASDFYRTIDLLRNPGSREPFRDSNRRLFHTTTDSNGVAMIRELPSWPLTFGAQHDNWEMPTEGAGERKRKLDLAPGMTNSITVKLQQKGTEQLEE